MKRDLSLIRRILLSVEEHDEVNVDCDESVLAFHLLLLTEQKLIRGIVVLEAMNGPPQVQQTMSYVRLTTAGHDFLDSIRDEGIWKKTKEKVAEVGGGAALDVVIAIAKSLIREKLGVDF